VREGVPSFLLIGELKGGNKEKHVRDQERGSRGEKQGYTQPPLLWRGKKVGRHTPSAGVERERGKRLTGFEMVTKRTSLGKGIYPKKGLTEMYFKKRGKKVKNCRRGRREKKRKPAFC